VAVGVGVVLARATRRRRLEPSRDRDRRLGLRPGEPPTQGLQRMALGQIDLAIDALEGTGAGEAPSANAVHETRKALKRLRALLRLLRNELGEAVFTRDDDAIRHIARHLSDARDAEVMLATLDALMQRHPSKLGRRKGVRTLRKSLLAEHHRIERQTLGSSAARAQVLAQLRALRESVAAWRLPDSDSTTRTEVGLLEIYAQGRKRLRRAGRKRGKDVRAMHHWRKRVKDLRYAAEMLERRPRSRGSKRGRDARLHQVAARADALAETLGEDHDLAVLAERVRAASKRSKRSGHARKRHSRPQPIGRTTRRTLLKLIARRRRKLRSRALRDGERLYRRGPRKLLRQGRR
jgi:CHAD domain